MCELEKCNQKLTASLAKDTKRNDLFKIQLEWLDSEFQC